jgi:RHS repeat-associated protein
VVIDCTYDDLYRLTSAVYSTGESYTYSYDPVGNRESLVTDSGSTSYEYDAADRLTSVNGTTYTWDDNGNLTSDGTRTFTYDAADRLLTVTGGGTNASYTYNGDGLRVGETVNSVSTSYAWDVAAPLPQVLANSGGATYVYGLGLLAQQQSGAWQYPLADGLGSVRHQVDPLGQVVASYRFSPFGVPLAASGGQPYGYAGEHWDAYTSLIYLRARWYDPATGRFLTRDPFPGLATLPATQHPYVYAGNNPVNLVDPSGEIAPILVAAGVGGVIGGVAGGARYVLAHPGGRPEDYLRSGDFWKATGVGFASGAVAGATGFWIGGVASRYRPGWGYRRRDMERRGDRGSRAGDGQLADTLRGLARQPGRGGRLRWAYGGNCRRCRLRRQAVDGESHRPNYPTYQPCGFTKINGTATPGHTKCSSSS